MLNAAPYRPRLIGDMDVPGFAGSPKEFSR